MIQLLLPVAFVLSTSGEPPVSWNFSSHATEQGQVVIRMEAVADAGWHIYATELENDLGPIPTAIRFTPSNHFAFVGPLVEPIPKEEYDPNFEMQVRYHSGKALFEQRIKPTSPKVFELEGEVEFMVCNDVTCLPPTIVPFRIKVPTQDQKQ